MHLIVGSPTALVIALLLSAAIAATIRRRTFGRSAAICFVTGAVLLGIAAANISLLVPSRKIVTVMVDLSPSTRGAAYRQTDLLRRRIAELLGSTRYQIICFGDRNVPGLPDGAAALPDLPAESTNFSPPPSDAILLFSDGRFAAPAYAAPTFAVLDPLLANAPDAAITRMQFIGNQLEVTVTNNGPPRLLTLHGVTGPATQTIDGNQTILRPLDPAADSFWAEISPGDAWPENDRVSIPPPPPLPTQRWWVGPRAPDGWQSFSPAELSENPADYLLPAVIILNNIRAEDLSPQTQQLLQQYVRDLGGAMLILGGDHAFSAGGYQGTILDPLSPLTSSPPAPSTQWILLADASGSMAQPLADGTSRWNAITHSIVDLLPHLPPNDPVRVGQFSDALKWWSDGLSAAQTAALSLPPPTAVPHGPTNLQPALEAIARAHWPMPTQLLLLTDADVELTDPQSLAALLKNADIRLHLLAIDRGSGIAELEDIVHDTGGGYITQLDPARWAAAVRELITAANPRAVVFDPIAIAFTGPAAAIPSDMLSPWNPAWIKPDAIPLAHYNDQILAADWHYGTGQVIAAAFAARPAQALALADLIAQPPRDPRFTVTWQTLPALHVTVDAIDAGTYLNNLDLQLEIWDQVSTVGRPIPQSAPGRYELTIPPSGHPAIATIRQEDRILARAALSGGYAAEFAAIGEDRPALQSLARATGGAVIEPTQTTPVDFHWPPTPHSLTPWLAAISAIFLGTALIIHKSHG